VSGGLPRKIVWLLSPPWDGVWTRQNHFARRFAREGVEILYVENPVSAGARLKAEGPGVLFRPAQVRTVEPGIRVMNLPMQIPGSTRAGMLARANGARGAAAIRRWLTAQGWDDYLVWCRLPGSVDTLKGLRPRAVVYDVTDDYVYYARSAKERAMTRAAEAAMAQRAQQVFTTTEALRDRLIQSNPRTAIIPNGVDPIFLQQPEGEADPLAHVPHPRIGFVGLVARWMDFDLLAKLGARWPGHVVIVGPVKPEVEAKLAAIPGLVRVGHVPHLQVPAYLRAFDVCILPHEVSELRHRADPLKIVEYMASGKPTVSVALRSVHPMHPYVDVARDHDAFLSLVAQRLADPRADLAPGRRAIAEKRGWDGLFLEVKDRLEATCAGRVR
jgi:glycosyltransferase involved in cell wall biosynthesis